MKNGGFGEEFLVKMTQILLVKATFQAFGAIHGKVLGKIFQNPENLGEGFAILGKIFTPVLELLTAATISGVEIFN